MNNITLSEIDLVGDFDLISEWDNHLSEPKFKSIFDFILEEGLILNLKELQTLNNILSVTTNEKILLLQKIQKQKLWHF